MTEQKQEINQEVSELDKILELIEQIGQSQEWNVDDSDEVESIIEELSDLESEFPEQPVAQKSLTDAPKQSEVDSDLHHIIAAFNPSKIESFEIQCQALIDKHGFLKFEEAFNKLLIEGHFSIAQRRALKNVNRFIMEHMANTVTAHCFEAVHNWHKKLMQVLEIPRHELILREELKKVVEDDDEEKAKIDNGDYDSAIEKAKSKAATEEEKNAIDTEFNLLAELKSRGRELATKDNKPFNFFYMELARWERLFSEMGFATSELAQQLDMISYFIIKDIVGKNSIDESTIALERYILLAEKLLNANNVIGALQIYNGVTNTAIIRLKASKEGLSQHAKQQLERMDQLFSAANNHKALRQHCAEHGLIIPTNIFNKDFTSFNEQYNTSLMAAYEKDSKKDNPLTLSDIDVPLVQNLKKNSDLINSQAMPGKGNEQIIKEVSQGKTDLTPPSNRKDKVQLESFNKRKQERSEKIKVLDEELFQKSLSLEPREKENQPSTVLSKLKTVMRSGLYATKGLGWQTKIEKLQSFKEMIDKKMAFILTKMTPAENKEEEKESKVLLLMKQVQAKFNSYFAKMLSGETALIQQDPTRSKLVDKQNEINARFKALPSSTVKYTLPKQRNYNNYSDVDKCLMQITDLNFAAQEIVKEINKAHSLGVDHVRVLEKQLLSVVKDMGKILDNTLNNLKNATLSEEARKLDNCQRAIMTLLDTHFSNKPAPAPKEQQKSANGLLTGLRDEYDAAYRNLPKKDASIYYKLAVHEMLHTRADELKFLEAFEQHFAYATTRLAAIFVLAKIANEPGGEHSVLGKLLSQRLARDAAPLTITKAEIDSLLGICKQQNINIPHQLTEYARKFQDPEDESVQSQLS